ncbi:hypothetical protein P691DRAFT_725054 [Macrolepiota fuliginosa MF-IS2]|uniref:tRNA (guanine(9)-N1)-methyltransferase n=1 Tax=Macrolepiota fuliginosa MF-IS2 TaxID=1400762 RepID=A0A9P6C474_9AGAR|nr:hypothetical protein P691DRAFT_725054 [Macrolepiota fuliginosa MF-IS2]
MDPPPLSKSAQKKAARAARFAEQKLLRRAKEKEAKKEKKRIRAERRAAGELDDDDEAEKAREKKKPRIQFGGQVIIDLGFDHLMSEKEVKSLCSQLAYTYSANRAASYPFSLLFTSLNGRSLQRLESLNDAGYKRWAKTEWWTEGYERLWNPLSDLTPNSIPQTEGVPSDASTMCAKDSIVYLTADSDEELSELKADETYIIGGIVDRNRFKNLCQTKAKGADVRTARLPIGKYLANFPTRKVLTVNQVFEILIKWAETKDWEVALNHVMPKRKFNAEGKHGRSKASADEEDDQGEDGTYGEEAAAERKISETEQSTSATLEESGDASPQQQGDSVEQQGADEA